VRLLILAALLYLAWRALKSWMAGGAIGRRTGGDLQSDVADDIMVQDPVCKVYFPKRDGVHLRSGGKDLYFCSPECRDRYLEDQSKDGGQA
jgi:YHS domain-containing protein